MSSVSVNLANAIVEELNREPEDGEEDFVVAFQARRLSAPMSATELTDAKQVQVSVFTGATRLERITRGSFGRHYKPVVAVQRPLDGGSEGNNLAIVDQCTELVEQIETRLSGADLAELSFVGFDEEQDREQYSVEAVKDLNFFTTPITLEYTDG